MVEFLRTTPAQVVIWMTALVILATVGLYIVLWVRDRQRPERRSPSEMLSDFRQLHDQGDLSPTEFQRIKSMLGEKLQDELDSKHADRSG